MKINFRIENKKKSDYLNTINTLNFQNKSKIFLSGTRDGFIKIYDPRNNIKPVIQVFISRINFHSFL